MNYKFAKLALVAVVALAAAGRSHATSSAQLASQLKATSANVVDSTGQALPPPPPLLDPNRHELRAWFRSLTDPQETALRNAWDHLPAHVRVALRHIWRDLPVSARADRHARSGSLD